MYGGKRTRAARGSLTPRRRKAYEDKFANFARLSKDDMKSLRQDCRKGVEDGVFGRIYGTRAQVDENVSCMTKGGLVKSDITCSSRTYPRIKNGQRVMSKSGKPLFNTNVRCVSKRLQDKSRANWQQRSSAFKNKWNGNKYHKGAFRLRTSKVVQV